MSDIIKSGNVVPYSVDLSKIISDADALGLNTINLAIKITVDNATSNDMSVDSVSKAEVISMIPQLKALGYKIILEPFPWIAGGTIGETSWNPSSLSTWFTNWKTVVLQPLIEDVAEEYSVEYFNIASNLINMESSTAEWQSTISFVRGLYSGEIIYRTNWWVTASWAPETITAYEAKLNNALFGDVDIISVAAYFELTATAVPTVSELVGCLSSTTKFSRGQNVFQEIKNFYDEWEKPIFFGELGFVNRELTASEPWNDVPSAVTSEIAQANCFAAYQQVFGEQDWFAGFSNFAIGLDTTNYRTVGKLAEDIIHDWYYVYSDVLGDYFYKPSFLVPNNVGIDPSVSNNFTWQNNMTMEQKYFRIRIYDNSDNTLAYDSDKIESGNTSFELPASSLTTNKYYKWTIDVYNDFFSYVSSSMTLFRTNVVPTLSVNAFPNPLTTQQYEFEATYSQSEGIDVRQYKFQLLDSGDEVVYDTGYIYGDELKSTITGLLRETNYKIKCIVVAQNGVMVESAAVSFAVAYDLPDSIQQLVVTPINEKGSIELNWENIRQVSGVINGSYEYHSSYGIVAGMNVPYWAVGLNHLVDDDLDLTIQNARRLKTDLMTISIRIDVDFPTSNTMTLNANSRARASKLYALCKNNNIKIVIEPHICIGNGDYPESAYNPANVSTWFADWKSMLSFLVGIYPNSDIICVGSNLTILETNSASWVDVFAHVKSISDAQVTYRTDWWTTTVLDSTDYQAKLNNTMFSDSNLDFISISAYFELNESEATPSKTTLLANLRSTDVASRGQDIYQEVKNFYTTHGKNIFFGEFGIPALDYGAKEPWNYLVSTVSNQTVQKNVFEAYAELFFPEDWFMGYAWSIQVNKPVKVLDVLGGSFIGYDANEFLKASGGDNKVINLNQYSTANWNTAMSVVSSMGLSLPSRIQLLGENWTNTIRQSLDTAWTSTLTPDPNYAYSVVGDGSMPSYGYPLSHSRGVFLVVPDSSSYLVSGSGSISNRYIRVSSYSQTLSPYYPIGTLLEEVMYRVNIPPKFNKNLWLKEIAELMYEEDIPEDFTIIFWANLPYNFTGAFLRIGDSFYFGYDGKRFFYKNGTRLTAGSEFPLPVGWFLVGIKHNKVIIVTDNKIDTFS